ncbi:MAG: sugar transferase [Piscirickettsiaceae bacterium]|nr:MAG: sugar transferase [Piscirickettsiaceae bacterium]
MDNLLFLVHRIPYPPNKGDKIRSFHFLKHLSNHFNIYLGAFIDDPDDVVYQAQVEQLCSEVNLLEINPRVRTVMSAKGLVTGEPLSVPYYDIAEMHQWVQHVISEHDIKKAFVFSSVMAQFVTPDKNIEMVADFVDVDSDKWRQYAEKKPWPVSWVYKRESERLFKYEKWVTKQAKDVLFVSDKEAAMFKELAPEVSENVGFVNNGVDIEFFKPSSDFDIPYEQHENIILFTGAMDYWANVDAVVWFVEHVLPKIHRINEGVVFYIVGSNPTDAVKKLQNNKVIVTGRVKDMPPYLQYAQVIVAPLRIARGIQNKVLEAMAMEKPIVATSAAMEGIGADIDGVSVADDPYLFCELVLNKLNKNVSVPENRVFVEKNFSWMESGNKLVNLLQ